jgi:uncharacterized RDD family membrane protein YckC
LVAAILDGLCAAIPVSLLYLIMGFLVYWLRWREPPDWLFLASPLFAFLAFVLIHGYFLRATGQTIGKKLTGIRIAGPDGKVPDFAKVILVRYFPIWLVSLIPFVGGFLVLLDVLFIFRSDRRCIHDLIAGTRVVTAQPLL